MPNFVYRYIQNMKLSECHFLTVVTNKSWYWYRIRASILALYNILNLKRYFDHYLSLFSWVINRHTTGIQFSVLFNKNWSSSLIYIIQFTYNNVRWIFLHLLPWKMYRYLHRLFLSMLLYYSMFAIKYPNELLVMHVWTYLTTEA